MKVGPARCTCRLAIDAAAAPKRSRRRTGPRQAVTQLTVQASASSVAVPAARPVRISSRRPSRAIRTAGLALVELDQLDDVAARVGDGEIFADRAVLQRVVQQLGAAAAQPGELSRHVVDR
jgi:hypothetical protein